MQQRYRTHDGAATLSREAADARALAATFSERQTVTDLENFAAALERAAFEMRHPKVPSTKRLRHRHAS